MAAVAPGRAAGREDSHRPGTKPWPWQRDRGARGRRCPAVRIGLSRRRRHGADHRSGSRSGIDLEADGIRADCSPVLAPVFGIGSGTLPGEAEAESGKERP